MRDPVKICRPKVMYSPANLKAEAMDCGIAEVCKVFERTAAEHLISLQSDKDWKIKGLEFGINEDTDLEYDSEFLPALSLYLSCSDEVEVERWTWHFQAGSIVRVKQLVETEFWEAVWKTKSGLELPVALKRIPEKEDVSSFELKALRLRKTCRQSENLSKILGVYTENNESWLVMQLYSRNLHHIIEATDSAGLPAADACRRGAEICSGLSVLHTAGFDLGCLVPRSVLWDARRRCCVVSALPCNARSRCSTAAAVSVPASRSPNHDSTATNGTEDRAPAPAADRAADGADDARQKGGAPPADAAYLAPEAFDVGSPGAAGVAGAAGAGDVWAAGCLMAEMLRGTAPWTGFAPPQIRRLVRPSSA